MRSRMGAFVARLVRRGSRSEGGSDIRPLCEWSKTCVILQPRRVQRPVARTGVPDIWSV